MEGRIRASRPIPGTVGRPELPDPAPVDDPNYLLIDLDLDDIAGAESLLAILRERVWASPDSSPALVGQPQARIVETVETTQA